MNAPSNIRDRLGTLRIPGEQRPTRGGRPRRRGRKLLIVTLVLAVVAGTAYLRRDQLRPVAERLFMPAPPPVRLLTVENRIEPPPILTATGKIVSDHKVAVATKVSGQIVALHFEQGDHVVRGQRLARVEDVIYRARRDEAAAQLEKSRASLAFQKVNFARTERLFKEASAPEIEYAGARRALEEAMAQVKADTATLASAQKALDDCDVVAPIGGVVLERNVEVGDFVAAEGGRGMIANAQVASIADMSKLRVEVDVSELDVARLYQGMPCRITPEAYKDRQYNGHILWLDPGANYSKATVQVKVRVENPDEYLRVEGSAQVVFLLEGPARDPATRPAPRPWIPASACRLSPDSKTARVFVESNGQLEEVTITLGRKAGGQLEVLDGLQQGQRIAAGDFDKLRPGQRIR